MLKKLIETIIGTLTQPTLAGDGVGLHNLAMFTGGGSGGAPPPKPSPAALMGEFETGGATTAEKKAGSRRKGSVASLVIPKPRRGVGPYGGGGTA
jgi:hypothetical protein